MNGFLISVPGRTFLSKVIKAKGIGESPDKACPTKGASQNTLLRVASTYLKEGIRNSKQNLQNFTGNEIKNLNTGGYIEDYYKIVGRLFRGYENLLSFSKPDTPGWTLSHAWIFLGTHAVTGAVRANGEYYIHDSNGQEYEVDWSKPGAIKNIKDAFRKTKYTLYNITIYPTYIKSDFLNNRNVQNTLQEAHEILNPAIKKMKNVLGNRYNQFIKNKKEFLDNKKLTGRLTVITYNQNGLNEKILKLANQLAIFRDIKNKGRSNEYLNRMLPLINKKFVVKLPVPATPRTVKVHVKPRPATKVSVTPPRTPPRPVEPSNLNIKLARLRQQDPLQTAYEEALKKFRKIRLGNHPPTHPDRPKSTNRPNRPAHPNRLESTPSGTTAEIQKVEKSIDNQVKAFLEKLKKFNQTYSPS